MLWLPELENRTPTFRKPPLLVRRYGLVGACFLILALPPIEDAKGSGGVFEPGAVVIGARALLSGTTVEALAVEGSSMPLLAVASSWSVAD